MSSARIVKILNPLNLEREEEVENMHFLSSFLQRSKDEFIPNNTIFVDNSKEFKLTHSLLKRACESKKNQGQHRFEALTETSIGKGAYGDIYKIACTIAVESDNTLKIKTKKPRVVKYVKDCSESGCTEPEILREFKLTSQAGHMNTKQPVFYKDTYTNKTHGFTVMRHLPGRRLFDILVDLIKGRLHLSIDQRLKLTLAILYALKNQVHDRSLVHRDIKPENILIDLLYDPPTVNIVDFGFAKRADETSKMFCGSRLYIAPEVVHSGDADARSDFFGLSLILGYLWNAEPIALNEQDTIRNILHKQKQYDFPNLCKKMEEQLSFMHEIKIYSILSFMHQYDRDRRPKDVNQIIQVFEEIQTERLEIQNQHAHGSTCSMN